MSRRRLPVSTRRAIRCVARLVGSLPVGLDPQGGGALALPDPSEAASEPALAQVASLDTVATLDGALLRLPPLALPHAWVGGAP